MAQTSKAVLPLLLVVSLFVPSHRISAADNPRSYCSLFTSDQIASMLGKPVKAGSAPEMATDACQWDAASGKGVVTVMATAAGIWNDMFRPQRQRQVPGIGQKAYVGMSAAGGTEAGAVAPCAK